MRRLLPLLLTFWAAACSDADRPGRIEGDLYVVMASGSEMNLAGSRVRLVEDQAVLDTVLADLCARRNRELAQLGGTARAPDSLALAAQREVLDRAWAERERILADRVRRTAVTDLGARFVLDSVPPGRYRLWTDARVGGERWTWLEPVRVRAGDSTRVNLSNANADDDPFRCQVDRERREREEIQRTVDEMFSS